MEPKLDQDVAALLELIPALSSKYRDSAFVVQGSLVLARALMREQFGVDPLETKKTEHIDATLQLLDLILQEARDRRKTGGAESPGIVRRTLHAPTAEGELRPRDERRRKELLRLLRVSHGNVSEVARAMGKARNQIVRWMVRFQIDVDEFRDD